MISTMLPLRVFGGNRGGRLDLGLIAVMVKLSLKDDLPYGVSLESAINGIPAVLRRFLVCLSLQLGFQ